VIKRIAWFCRVEEEIWLHGAILAGPDEGHNPNEALLYTISGNKDYRKYTGYGTVPR
jgi:hypothetical protein